MENISKLLFVLLLFTLSLPCFAEVRLGDDALAIIEMNKGNTTKALELINKQIQDDENMKRDCIEFSYNTRGLIKENMNLYDDAIVDYTKAISINSKYANAYYNRGSLFYRMEKYDNALYDLNKAISLKSDASYYNVRGSVRAALNDLDGAFLDYNKSISLNNNSEAPYFNRGKVYFINKQYLNAIKDFTNAIKIKNKNPDAFLYRGLSKCFLNNPMDGLKDIGWAKQQYLEQNDIDAYKECIEFEKAIHEDMKR